MTSNRLKFDRWKNSNSYWYGVDATQALHIEQLSQCEVMCNWNCCKMQNHIRIYWPLVKCMWNIFMENDVNSMPNKYINVSIDKCTNAHCTRSHFWNRSLITHWLVSHIYLEIWISCIRIASALKIYINVCFWDDINNKTPNQTANFLFESAKAWICILSCYFYFKSWHVT